MKKILIVLALLSGGVAGCVNPFMQDPAQAERVLLDKRLADQDARLVAAQAALEKAVAEAKATGNSDMLKAAESMATSVSELRAQRDATQKTKDELPKAHVDVDSLLGMGEGLAGLTGFGWVVALIRNGRKAKQIYDTQLAQNDSHFTAAVAGIQDFSADLPPELKKKLYETLAAAAKEHTDDPMGMAVRVAIAKTKLRGSI